MTLRPWMWPPERRLGDAPDAETLMKIRGLTQVQLAPPLGRVTPPATQGKELLELIDEVAD